MPYRENQHIYNEQNFKRMKAENQVTSSEAIEAGKEKLLQKVNKLFNKLGEGKFRPGIAFRSEKNQRNVVFLKMENIKTPDGIRRMIEYVDYEPYATTIAKAFPEIIPQPEKQIDPRLTKYKDDLDFVKNWIVSEVDDGELDDMGMMDPKAVAGYENAVADLEFSLRSEKTKDYYNRRARHVAEEKSERIKKKYLESLQDGSPISLDQGELRGFVQNASQQEITEVLRERFSGKLPRLTYEDYQDACFIKFTDDTGKEKKVLVSKNDILRRMDTPQEQAAWAEKYNQQKMERARKAIEEQTRPKPKIDLFGRVAATTQTTEEASEKKGFSLFGRRDKETVKARSEQGFNLFGSRRKEKASISIPQELSSQAERGAFDIDDDETFVDEQPTQQTDIPENLRMAEESGAFDIDDDEPTVKVVNQTKNIPENLKEAGDSGAFDID